MTRARLATALVCIAVSFATWFSLNTIKHAVNDHTLLHQLVQIEIAREQALQQPKFSPAPK